MGGISGATFWWQYTAPSSLPNLEVWYNGAVSDSTTFNNGVITSGTEVSAWHNSGGLSSHDWNSTGGARPEWFSNQQNGLGVVRFNAPGSSPTGEDGDTNENLTINPVTYINSLSGATMFILFKSLSTSSGIRYCSSTDVGGFQFGQNGTQWIGGFAGATFSIDNISADTNYHRIAIKFDGTQTGNSNRLKVKFDGVEVPITITGTVNSATSSAAKYFYGGATGTSASNQSNFWIGDIGELMIFTRTMSDGEISTVENYLTTKWAV